MHTTTPTSSRKALGAVLFVGGAFLASASSGLAQVINYQWTGNTDNDWATRTNWSPDPGSGAIGTNANTRFHRVTIDGDVSVIRVGDVAFYNSGTAPSGTNVAATALTLSGGADLSITGNLRITSSSGSYIRNAAIGAGSNLTVSGNLTVGASNATGAVNTWTINGSVTAANLVGMQSTSPNPGINGGYIFNISGGSLTITNEFNWHSQGTRTDLIGQVNLSNGGTVSAETMLNWTASDGNFVNFVDGTGILTFGKTGYEDQSLVRELMDDGFIRLGSGLEGYVLNLTDLGTSWQITAGLAPIPEPSSAALILGAAAVTIAAGRRRRASLAR